MRKEAGAFSLSNLKLEVVTGEAFFFCCSQTRGMDVVFATGRGGSVSCRELIAKPDRGLQVFALSLRAKGGWTRQLLFRPSKHQSAKFLANLAASCWI
jgi:hypothetical protein